MFECGILPIATLERSAPIYVMKYPSQRIAGPRRPIDRRTCMHGASFVGHRFRNRSAMLSNMALPQTRRSSTTLSSSRPLEAHATLDFMRLRAPTARHPGMPAQPCIADEDPRSQSELYLTLSVAAPPRILDYDPRCDRGQISPEVCVLGASSLVTIWRASHALLAETARGVRAPARTRWNSARWACSDPVAPFMTVAPRMRTYQICVLLEWPR